MSTAVMDPVRARHFALEQQIRPWMLVPEALATAFLNTAREDFLPPEWQHRAYSDIDTLALGHGQVALAPKVQIRLLADAKLRPQDHVLLIGAGCGYMAALAAQLAAQVTAYEAQPELANNARVNLLQAHINNAQVIAADVLHSSISGNYDAIIFCGAIAELPAEWLNKLKPHGRLVSIMGQAPSMRVLTHTRQADASIRTDDGWDTLAPYLHGFEPARSFSL